MLLRPLSFREVAMYGFMPCFMIVDEFLMMWPKRSEASQCCTERMPSENMSCTGCMRSKNMQSLASGAGVLRK